MKPPLHVLSVLNTGQLRWPGAAAADNARPPLASTAAERQGDVPIVDWDTLFGAVTATLRHCVDASRLAAPAEASHRLEQQVLQCVEALDQLRSTIVHHIAGGGALDAQLSDAQAALARTRADLAHAQASEHAARHRAAHDGLTSLPNRDGFRARLADVLMHAASRGQVFALLYIDLDGFKAINDTHGHATGDDLLRIIAARLAAAVRAQDMVSRVGGDEFACLLWDSPPGRPALTRLATTLFDIVSAPFQIGASSLTVRPSIGIALWPADGLTMESLLDRADTAMYHAKRKQTGHAYFDQLAQA